MNIAFVGSHGTGKTTVLNEVARLRPEWNTLSEATRHLVPRLGFSTPYEIVDHCGIAFYEAIIIAHWCVLDPSYNTKVKGAARVTLIDRSPLDNLAYFQVHRSPDEERFEPILTRLALHYLTFIDHLIYFPTGVFALTPDPMQKLETQLAVDGCIKPMLQQHHPQYYTIDAKSAAARAEEVLNFIESHLNHSIQQ